MLPELRHPSKALCRVRVCRWWKTAETLAGLEPKRGRGWHSLRRKFATDLMELPLKVLCELGGWKNAQTVLGCYQQADEGQLRKALESRRRVRGSDPNRRESIGGNRDTEPRKFNDYKKM